MYLCVYFCASKAAHLKKHHTFFAVCCVMFKNNGGLILIFKNRTNISYELIYMP